jgi:cytochrome b
MTRKKKSNPAKRNLFLDIGIAGAFLVALSPDITGYAIHEWFGLAFLGTLLVHLLLHWKWVVAITKKLFAKMPIKTRISYVLNATLLWTFSMIGLTGFLMGESVGLGIETGLIRAAHEVFANLSIALVLAHLAMHLKWLVTTIKRYVFGMGPGNRAPRRVLKPAAAKISSS